MGLGPNFRCHRNDLIIHPIFSNLINIYQKAQKASFFPQKNPKISDKRGKELICIIGNVENNTE